MVSRGPWVWVQLGGWGPRGLPDATPAQLCPCPESMFRVAAGRWPCTGPDRVAAQTVLVTSAQAKVPVSVGRAWGLGERQGVNGTASKRRWCPLPVWRRDTQLCGPCLSTDELRKMVFPRSRRKYGTVIYYFYFTASCRVKVIFPYATSWLDVNGQFCPSTCYQQWKTFQMYE